VATTLTNTAAPVVAAVPRATAALVEVTSSIVEATSPLGPHIAAGAAGPIPPVSGVLTGAVAPLIERVAPVTMPATNLVTPLASLGDAPFGRPLSVSPIPSTATGAQTPAGGAAMLTPGAPVALAPLPDPAPAIAPVVDRVTAARTSPVVSGSPNPITVGEAPAATLVAISEPASAAARSSDPSPDAPAAARGGGSVALLPSAGSGGSVGSPVVSTVLAVLSAVTLLWLRRSWLLELESVSFRSLRLITLLERPG
jgi:hypothetical protein